MLETKKERQMAKRYFERSGRGVFACDVCGRNTRNTGQGDQICAECFEIAGLDNMVNDNAYKPGSEEYAGALKECEALLAKAVKLGGDAEKIKDQNGYIWPS
jgi:hypothetical protein